MSVCIFFLKILSGCVGYDTVEIDLAMELKKMEDGKGLNIIEGLQNMRFHKQTK